MPTCPVAPSSSAWGSPDPQNLGGSLRTGGAQCLPRGRAPRGDGGARPCPHVAWSPCCHPGQEERFVGVIFYFFFGGGSMEGRGGTEIPALISPGGGWLRKRDARLPPGGTAFAPAPALAGCACILGRGGRGGLRNVCAPPTPPKNPRQPSRPVHGEGARRGWRFLCRAPRPLLSLPLSSRHPPAGGEGGAPSVHPVCVCVCVRCGVSPPTP